jgi:hypothetical protein
MKLARSKPNRFSQSEMNHNESHQQRAQVCLRETEHVAENLQADVAQQPQAIILPQTQETVETLARVRPVSE